MSTKMLVACAYCGKDIQRPPSKVYRPGRKYHFCSRHCASLFRRNGEYITCSLCGKKVYRPLGKLHRGEKDYCSGECERKAQRRGKMMPCETCGKLVYKEAWRLKKYKHHYCSRACFGASNVSGKCQTCAQCGKSVYKPESRLDREQFFCSEQCRRDNIRNGHYVECEVCGKEVYRSEYHLNAYEHSYCSTECMYVGQRQGEYIECETCDESFWVSPSQKERRYCSQACFRRANGETTLEKAVREALEVTHIKFVSQESRGRFCLDFWLPIFNVAIEADGDYWHQDKERDIDRDARLLEEYAIPTIRIKEYEMTNQNTICNILAQRLWRMEI